MAKIEGIFIYSDYPSKSLSIPKIINCLKEYGFSAQYRGDLFEFLPESKDEAFDLARIIAGTRILDITSPLDEIHEPTYEEIDLEISRLTGKGISLGVLYDGLWLQRMFYKNMAEKVPHEFRSGFIHLIFTSRLFGTYETGGSLTTLPLDGNVGSGGGFYRAPYSYPRSQGNTIGAVVRTKKGTKPVFVSIGHKIDLRTAVRITRECTKGHRIPEPTRKADIFVE